MPSATGSSASEVPRGPPERKPGGAAQESPRALDDPVAMRRAGRDLLSLALIDARNHLLRLLLLDESRDALRLATRAGAFQEYWIARHVQRGRGEGCDPQGPRLAGIEPQLERWLALDGPPPTPEALRGYLQETLEITLDLLGTASEDEAGLYFFRQALLHEDRLGEALAEQLLVGAPPARAQRPALWLPAQRWTLGTPEGGWAPHNERGAHEVAVPEFEIDAQPVSWARYVEFSDDAGYDREELWSGAGWAWLQAEGRRAPRHVEQLHGGVLVLRRQGGKVGLQRAPAAQAVMHVSRFEAEAWCQWAGRRLPTEPEWEIAASSLGSRGFVWGDVFEWMAGTARPWPGAETAAASPGSLDDLPPLGTQGVLRGASFATRSRWHHPKARRFMRLAQDVAFCGFRSCAP